MKKPSPNQCRNQFWIGGHLHVAAPNSQRQIPVIPVLPRQSVLGIKHLFDVQRVFCAEKQQLQAWALLCLWVLLPDTHPERHHLQTNTPGGGSSTSLLILALPSGGRACWSQHTCKNILLSPQDCRDISVRRPDHPLTPYQEVSTAVLNLNGYDL